MIIIVTLGLISLIYENVKYNYTYYVRYNNYNPTDNFNMISNVLTVHNNICNCSFRKCLWKLTNIFIDFVQVVYETITDDQDAFSMLFLNTINFGKCNE